MPSTSDHAPGYASRALWQLFEPLHAVTYFAPPCLDGMGEVGMKGFWMGYFAGRAAPMGPVGPAVVEATFYNFAPGRVRRALPDAWSLTTPADVLAARSSSAAIALRQLVPEADEFTRRALPLLESVVAAARCDGRPLAAANQRVPAAADPVERLWQATTTLREHRGDGHVAALVAHDVSGLESHLLAVATAPGAADAERIRLARGWSAEEWEAASEGLAERGLLDADGATDAAHLLHSRIEHVTDEIAWQPFRDGLTATGLDLLRTVLRPFAAAVIASEAIPFPNPIGLPRPLGPS